MIQTRWICIGSLICGGILCLPGCGESEAKSTPSVVTAIKSPGVDLDQVYSVGDYEKAVPLLQQHLEQFGNDGRNWFRLGYALHSLEKYEEAIEAYKNAASADSTNAPIAFYNWSCALALLNKPDEALDKLEMAVAGGFNRLKTIQDDPDLESIRYSVRFEKLLADMDAPHRDSSMSEHTEFDFWIGDWDLEDRVGRRSIRTSVQLEQNGFVLTESWRGEKKESGTVMTFFDPVSKAWQQTRVSNRGVIERYSGKVEGRVVRLLGDVVLEDGSQAKRRITMTPDENDEVVRYRVEESTDAGDTWSEVFNGRWVRRKPRLAI